MKNPEIVAPAGNFASLLAAAKFGADAVYIGLKEFSARMRAENFSVREFKDAVYLMRRRGKKVYLALNILFKNDEIDRLIETVHEAAEVSPDALIIQDLGLYRILKKWFPAIPIHASTQLACYNLDGALQLQDLGFKRVVLSRELSLNEIEKIRAGVKIELEVFIHGALCYCFSGLCLFSSHIGGRSGNRGQCAQPCRKAYTIFPGADKMYLFSMNDLSLADYIVKLKEMRVDALKIEGRLKNPYYSGFVSSYYRRVVDGDKDYAEKAKRELKLFYSRNFVEDYMGNRRAEITDLDHPANVGLFIGKVSESGGGWIRFRTGYDIEARDGIQIFCGKKPVAEFSVKEMKAGGRKVYKASCGTEVCIRCAEKVKPGADVYISSSQRMKRAYSLTKLDRVIEHYKMPVDFDVEIEDKGISVKAVSGGLSEVFHFGAEVVKSKKAGVTGDILKSYFSRLGNTEFELRGFAASVPAGVYVSPAALNDARRKTVDRFRAFLEENKKIRIETIKEGLERGPAKVEAGGLRWSVKIDRIEYLDFIPAEKFQTIYFDITFFDPGTGDWEKINRHKEKIIVSMPLLRVEGVDYGALAEMFLKEGFARWQAQNVGDVRLFKKRGVDFCADYPLYCLNALSADQVIGMGAASATFSPEDEKENLIRNVSALKEKGEVIVYQDTPLFVSRVCARKYYKGCTGCKHEEFEIANDEGDGFIVADRKCYTVVINKTPYSISDRVKEIAMAGGCGYRIDFCYKRYDAETISQVLNSVLRYETVPSSHTGNYNRTLF